MGKYCCFFDPNKSYDEHELTDKCPICGLPLGYPLYNKPINIFNPATKLQYQVIEAIGRGFYSVTYLCEVQKRFRKEKALLKVIPIDIYKYFGKDFENECRVHAEIASNTDHIVQINDAFESEVKFDENILSCYVAELEYIVGDSLDKYLMNNDNITPINFAQIAIDLLTIWNELIKKEKYHNDLHAGNLIVQSLDYSIQRTDALNDRIKLVAIDLNSAADESFSHAEKKRIGDQQFLANHFLMLTGLLREKYIKMDDNADTDYRLIETLEKISILLSFPATVNDLPNNDELIKMIKEEFYSDLSYSPWNKRLALARLNEGINAQTISSCHTPLLLVDPDEMWIKKISIAEPQLITGMRGCGKTMLLNALDVHARIYGQGENEEIEEKIKRIVSDEYLGLITSCRNLVDGQGQSNLVKRLLWLYSIQAIRAARHLKDIANNLVKKDFHKDIILLIEKVFEITIPSASAYSVNTLEKYLSLNTNQYTNSHEADLSERLIIEAFELLANTLTGISPLFANKRVFFLLDDASTRYLSPPIIASLLSKIMFMSQTCSFKITTEMQTLSFGFKSLGNIERAHDIRDFQIFDLGADVYEKTKDPVKGIKFIEDILTKRVNYCNSITKSSPKSVLGNCTLASIAKNIIQTKSNPSRRKGIYHGITALSALCVGDIGDIIFLYDIISSYYNDKTVTPERQTECYQLLCSRRLYNLERTSSHLREYAKAFAEASYRLLVNSFDSFTKDGEKSKRIRQYNSLYIRMTEGNIERQSEQLRELIDSGLFVFSDGTGWPRANNADHDPTMQFKLAYRKLFGLSNFIGLANSDRFELQGNDLENWLNNPSKEELLNHLGIHDEKEEIIDNSFDESEHIKEKEDIAEQLNLFDWFDKLSQEDNNNPDYEEEYIKQLVKRIHIKELRDEDLCPEIAIFGLGFEERSFESIKRTMAKYGQIKEVIFVEYNEIGFKTEILHLFDDSNKIPYKIINYSAINDLLKNIECMKHILIDITGLYKPIIFQVIRYALINQMKVDVCYTEAIKYYPLNSEISQNLIDKEQMNQADQFNKIMNSLIMGETAPYIKMALIDNKHDSLLRPDALIGFVSPKNQRLFSLLDDNEYERIHLIIPNGNTDRAKLSQAAAEVILSNYSNVSFVKTNTNSIDTLIRELAICYIKLYKEEGMNIEISLTGTKMQAVISAIFSSVCKISQCWYIKPSKFDTEHFTVGVGNTTYYSLN